MENVDEGIKVINTLSELIYPQLYHETQQPQAENAAAEPELSEPIDIETDHDEYQYSEFEENEIPDETDDTEFIAHETEPLLQGVANQIIDDITMTTDNIDENSIEGETEKVQGQPDNEINSDSTPTEASVEQEESTTSEITEAENIENSTLGENQNEDLLATTDANPPDDAQTERNEITESKTEASSPPVEKEVSPVTEPSEEATTQIIRELTSRTTVLEPVDSPVSTTIANFMHNINDEITTTSSALYETTTIDTRREEKAKFSPNLFFRFFLFLFAEKNHRADIDYLAVSLGLSCYSDKQCQLADSNSYCSEEKVCECQATQNSAISSECTARKTGCAEGTFQVK